MHTYTIRYLDNGFGEEYETSATNILIAIGNFLDETGSDIDTIASVEC